MVLRRGIRAARRGPCSAGWSPRGMPDGRPGRPDGAQVRSARSTVRGPARPGPPRRTRGIRAARAGAAGPSGRPTPESGRRAVRTARQLGGEPVGAVVGHRCPPDGHPQRRARDAGRGGSRVVVRARMSTTRSKNARVAAGRAVSSGRTQRNTGSSVNAAASAEATAAASVRRALRTSAVVVRTVVMSSPRRHPGHSHDRDLQDAIRRSVGATAPCCWDVPYFVGLGHRQPRGNPHRLGPGLTQHTQGGTPECRK